MTLLQQFSEQQVASGDASLFVRTLGGYDGGPTLIVLHGGPGLSHEYELPNAILASDQLRVVFYDQREVGRSTGVAASYEPLQQWADDLEAVRGAVGADRVHLLGHSAGGFPAMVYDNAFPGHTASIIFVDSVPPTKQELNKSLDRATTRIAALQATGFIPAEIPADGTLSLQAIWPVYFVDPTPRAEGGLNGATMNDEVNNRTFRALGEYDLRPIVARLTVPTLIFASAVPFGLEMGQSLYEALPKARAKLVLMENCGHNPFTECPDMFFAEVKAFLAPFLVRPQA